MGAAFYRGCDACILTYDITDEKSFADLEKWRDVFISQGSVRDPERFPFLVVGNKADLEVT